MSLFFVFLESFVCKGAFILKPFILLIYVNLLNLTPCFPQEATIQVLKHTEVKLFLKWSGFRAFCKLGLDSTNFERILTNGISKSKSNFILCNEIKFVDSPEFRAELFIN